MTSNPVRSSPPERSWGPRYTLCWCWTAHKTVRAQCRWHVIICLYVRSIITDSSPKSSKCQTKGLSRKVPVASFSRAWVKMGLKWIVFYGIYPFLKMFSFRLYGVYIICLFTKCRCIYLHKTVYESIYWLTVWILKKSVKSIVIPLYASIFLNCEVNAVVWYYSKQQCYTSHFEIIFQSLLLPCSFGKFKISSL